MENSELNESQSEKNFIERPYASLGDSGQVREYIEELKATNNVAALQTLFGEVDRIYQAMLKTSGGEYAFQFHQYAREEVKEALDSFNE